LACTDSDTLGLSSDGLQWVNDQNPIIEWLYKEWWFFAIYDEKADVAMAFGYSVTDPQQQLGLEATGIAGQWWPTVKNNPGNDMISIIDVYPFESFMATPDNATIKIGDVNSITVLDDKTYRVVGAAINGSASWNLTMTQLVYACREQVDVPELMQLDWISYMPSAHAQGTVTISGSTYDIDTIAYHDHNYGSWPTSLFNWIWCQFSSPENDFAVVMGGYHIPLTDTYIGYVFIRYQGLRIKIGTLCDDTFELQPLQWQTVNGLEYSIHNKVLTYNDEYLFEMDYQAKLSNYNPGGRGLDLSVFEQLSNYNVAFYQKNSTGGWSLLVSTTGWGFSEWSNVVIL